MHFKYSNKCGKYLANQIKCNKEKTISTIVNSAGKIVKSPEEINKTFQDFYNNLYSSTHKPNQKYIDTFLNNIVDQAVTLEKPFTITEFHNALNLMPNNKSPGPDGFSAEYCKHFWNTLSPIFNILPD